MSDRTEVARLRALLASGEALSPVDRDAIDRALASTEPGALHVAYLYGRERGRTDAKRLAAAEAVVEAARDAADEAMQHWALGYRCQWCRKKATEQQVLDNQFEHRPDCLVTKLAEYDAVKDDGNAEG